MTTVFKVDHREGKLKDLLEATKAVECVYENLEFGDFQLLYNGTIHFIFERKTIDDLIASIKDGRYNNQRARLFQTFPAHQIYYIIEGPFRFSTELKGWDLAVQSCILNSSLRNKVGVFTTHNLQETYQLLVTIAQRFMKEPLLYTEPKLPQEVTVSSSSAEDSEAKVFRSLLCQVPGLSDKTATVFTQRWPTFGKMYQEMLPLDTTQRHSFLSDMKVNNRKISKKIVENLLKHLF